MISEFPITITGVTSTLPKVEQRGRESVFENPTKTLVTSISHRETKAGRVIHTVEFRSVHVPDEDDPLSTTSQTIRVTFDRDLRGISLANVDDLWAGIKTAMGSTLVGKIFGQES